LASKNTIVYSFEKDKNIIEIARLNPYSKLNENIKLFNEDVFHGIRRFKDGFFNGIIHDPPTFKLANELYSREFYNELYRVLKRKGRLYHYAPWPGKLKKEVFYLKIVRRLKEAGFKDVKYKEKSSGVSCVKL